VPDVVDSIKIERRLKMKTLWLLIGVVIGIVACWIVGIVMVVRGNVVSK